MLIVFPFTVFLAPPVVTPPAMLRLITDIFRMGREYRTVSGAASKATGSGRSVTLTPEGYKPLGCLNLRRAAQGSYLHTSAQERQKARAKLVNPHSGYNRGCLWKTLKTREARIQRT